MNHRAQSIFVPMTLLMGLLTSCSISRYSASSNSGDERRNLVVQAATKFLGSPYQYGGLNRNGFDCSGLIYTAFKNAGVELPRTTFQQFKIGKHIQAVDGRKGDLIFFTQQGKINHVSLITKVSKGSVWVIHSTTSKGVIREDIMASTYWRKRIKGVRDALSYLK